MFIYTSAMAKFRATEFTHTYTCTICSKKETESLPYYSSRSIYGRICSACEALKGDIKDGWVIVVEYEATTHSSKHSGHCSDSGPANVSTITETITEEYSLPKCLITNKCVSRSGAVDITNRYMTLFKKGDVVNSTCYCSKGEVRTTYEIKSAKVAKEIDMDDLFS